MQLVYCPRGKRWYRVLMCPRCGCWFVLEEDDVFVQPYYWTGSRKETLEPFWRCGECGTGPHKIGGMSGAVRGRKIAEYEQKRVGGEDTQP